MTENYFKEWQQGYGVIKHSKRTIQRVEKLVNFLKANNIKGDGNDIYKLFAAADKLANFAMWLVVHQTYAKKIYLDGRDLVSDDFKLDPQGHLGASLNMIPAYIGYLLINSLTGITRSWVMEQGHAVAAIDTVNLLVENMHEVHASRYDLSEEGLSRFVNDFYSYKLNKLGLPDSPLGSHVNPYTGGGHLEGGYLGFASLQYCHMPLKNEQLVAFLSDGAFEEQRGSDWTPRWWRAEDCGLIAPIMIANGRRIDQRSILAQEGGAKWFKKFLKLNNFTPIVFDGRDPAAFAYSIWLQENKLQDESLHIKNIDNYDIKIPYGIAVAPKGAGFYNEGTNAAHNLPLEKNPHDDDLARQHFNQSVKKLFVEFSQLKHASSLFKNHKIAKRIKEKDNPIANREVRLELVPSLALKIINKADFVQDRFTKISAMEAIDDGFLNIVKHNPSLRPRIGNPDELRSNKMIHSLENLEFRVVKKAKDKEESSLGKIITALNEEAIAGAAFGNKGGINIIVSYEAFASKIFGMARQEVIFSKHCKEIGKKVGWLSVPIILTSNTWENSKNELSHQDPSFVESMLGETSDISRVIFVPDYNVAMKLMEKIYQTQGQIWSMVVAKQKSSLLFEEEEAISLVENGAIEIKWAGYNTDEAKIALIAIGSYQLIEVIKAAKKLKENKIANRVIYIMEPGKFRVARNLGEEEHLASTKFLQALLPNTIENIVLVSHTRAEIIVGMLQNILNKRNFKALGFINQGGTLGIDDMLYVNKSSWAHILKNISQILNIDSRIVLSHEERQVLNGERSPDGIITKIS